MVLAIVRRIAPAALLLALIAWAGCRDEPITGPTSSVGSTAVLAGPLSFGPEVIPTGSGESEAYGVNDKGWVVGKMDVCETETECDDHPFLYRDGGVEDLIKEVSPWSEGEAYDINDDGVVAGSGRVLEGEPAKLFYRAFTWSEAGGMAALPKPLGYDDAYGRAINETGRVAGYASGSKWGAVEWLSPTSATVHGDITGMISSMAYDIGPGDAQDPPAVVGASSFGEYTEATVWNVPPSLLTLPRLGGADSWAEAYGISDTDDHWIVVGYSEDDDYRQIPVRWTSATVIERLEPEGSGNYGVAYAVNDNGDAVGDSWTDDSDERATFWPMGGDKVLLPMPSGATSCYARDININNVVVGFCEFSSGPGAVIWREGGGGSTGPIADLKTAIDDLVDGDFLNEGQGTSLTSKVESAERKYAQGKTKSAVNKLKAFINEVEDLVATEVLTAEQGDELIELAEAAIDVFLGD